MHLIEVLDCSESFIWLLKILLVTLSPVFFEINPVFTQTSNSVSGRKIAIDASMSIYQFLIAVRSDGSQLTNEAGEITR